MADQSNDTQSKINAEDRDIAARPENRTGHDRDKFNQGSSSMPGGANEAEGIFAHDGEGVTGEALGGGPLGTGNTGAELPGGAQSEFARTSGGQTDGLVTGTGGAAGSPSGGAGGQSVGTVGTIGGSSRDTDLTSSAQTASTGTRGTTSQGGTNEYGAQGVSGEPAGADHQHSALGGSVTAAGGNSDSPGPGQTGTDRSASAANEDDSGAG